ncbi:MAG: amidohydrolase, partial [Cyclobacteriaceae bacterium]
MNNLLIKIVLVLFSAGILLSCQEDQSEKGDLIVHGGNIYTAASEAKAEAVVTKDGKILFVGSKEEAMKFQGDSTEVLDLKGKTMTPGFIESHAHIMGIGYNRLNIDLMQVKSYEELIQKVEEVAANTPKGEWILGRGWHQDKWDEQSETRFKGFPTHDELSARVPDHPVWLKHASGHMGLANAAAMQKAGINQSSEQPEGGEIFMGMDGNPTGIFNETAQGEIGRAIPASTPEREAKALELAIQELTENGITSMHNAGAVKREIDLFKKFAEEGKLDVRVYTMLNGRDSALLAAYYKSGPEVGLYDDHLTVKSIKLYADGALGSRGAWLLEEYTDATGKFGHNVMPMSAIEEVTKEGYENGFQICIHAIGDRANREVLDIFERTIKEGDDHRFRIEHAQHISLEDIPRFAELGVIASVQAIHMSSDRPWAIDRLGIKRIVDGAYVWQKLLQSGAKVINGTDAPVEPVSALASFYSSVSRKTLKGTPEEGYEPEQKMTRDQALKAYTLDGAYGAFEEDIK